MFKIGDRVKVIKNTSGGHEEGTVGVVDYIDSQSECSYLINSNGKKWWHFEANLISVGFTPADLKDGMVVTRRNGGKSVLINDQFVDSDWQTWGYISGLDNGFNSKIISDYDLVKIEEVKSTHCFYIFFKGCLDKSVVVWQREDHRTLKLKEDIKQAELKIREARLNLKTLQDQLNAPN